MQPMLADPCSFHIFKILSPGPESLETCYQAMDVLINEVDGYVENWLRFQSLWDLNMDLILEALGQDIGSWMDCLKVGPLQSRLPLLGVGLWLYPHVNTT